MLARISHQLENKSRNLSMTEWILGHRQILREKMIERALWDEAECLAVRNSPQIDRHFALHGEQATFDC